MKESLEKLPVSRRTAAWIVSGLIAVPAVYVALAIRSTPAVQATVATSTQTQQGSTVDVASMEQLAKSKPSVDNRLNLSNAYIQNGMQGRAIPILTGIIAEAPSNALAWNDLCVAHMMQKEYSLAVAACESGVRYDEATQLFRNNLRWAQDEKAKTLAALSEQGKTAVANRTAGFYLDEGMNHLHLGEYDAALADWQQSLVLDPRNALAENNIGLIFMLRSQYAEAEASFRRAVMLAPDNQLARNNLAWALSMQGGAR